ICDVAGNVVSPPGDVQRAADVGRDVQRASGVVAVKDRAEDIRDKANLTWLQREFCTAARKADEWISSVFLVQKIDVEGTVRRVVERDVGRPVAAECAARATNAGKDELLTQRRAHDAPFLHDIASTS